MNARAIDFRKNWPLQGADELRDNEVKKRCESPYGYCDPWEPISCAVWTEVQASRGADVEVLCDEHLYRL